MVNILSSVITSSEIGIGTFLVCTAVSVLLGAAAAWIHSFRNRTSSSFLLTIGLIPVIVQVIIMLVNGNLGAGVAVAGAFSLVRFRSAPGTAREISSLFLAMAVGLATGMGYLTIACLLVLIVGMLTVFLPHLFKANAGIRTLTVNVPEILDFEGIIDEVLEKYTKTYELNSVKSVSMGTLYRLSYDMVLLEKTKTKELLDAIRECNGNLDVSISRSADHRDEAYL